MEFLHNSLQLVFFNIRSTRFIVNSYKFRPSPPLGELKSPKTILNYAQLVNMN